MTTLEAILFGIVEGITEFLPISSTAHLDLTRLLLGISESPFIKSFEIAIQLGAILAVVYLYRQKIFSSFFYFKKVLIAFIPTGIVGFLLYSLIKNVLLGNTMIMAWALLLGGIAIVLFERYYKAESFEKVSLETVPAKDLVLIGLAQSLAVIPGVSRSLSVILSGRMLGMSKVLVTEFSFLLAVPTMLIATIYDLYKTGFTFERGEWGALSVGFVVSFVVAFFLVDWLIKYIKNHSFSIFGYYRILLGGLVLIFGILL